MNISIGNIEELFVKSIKEKNVLQVEEIYKNCDNKYILINKVKEYRLLDSLIEMAKDFMSLGHKQS